MMPLWAWLLVGIAAGYLLVQLVLLVRLARMFLKELTRR